MQNKFFLILSDIKEHFLNYKPKQVTAINREHLDKLILKSIKKYGDNCDLNYIDVSQITDMSDLFRNSTFNGNISQWNTSKVTNMGNMFYKCQFNSDISNWNVSSVDNMDSMFRETSFNQDISNWTPYSLTNFKDMFKFIDNPFNIPYWATYENSIEINRAINHYQLNKELGFNNVNKKVKI